MRVSCAIFATAAVSMSTITGIAAHGGGVAK
jgi:hypothetical protein